ncbi:MAG: DciA family protein [Candidatus Peregrinibacteria bacterium]
MEKLGDIAKKRFNQHKLGGASQASYVLFTAQKWLRNYFEQEPDAAKPIKLQNATLWISVKHPGWAQELRGVEGKLLAELQACHGKALVQKIRTKSLTSS